MSVLYITDDLHKHDQHLSQMVAGYLSSIIYICLLAVCLSACHLPDLSSNSGEHCLTEATASKSIISGGVRLHYGSIQKLYNIEHNFHPFGSKSLCLYLAVTYQELGESWVKGVLMGMLGFYLSSTFHGQYLTNAKICRHRQTYSVSNPMKMGRKEKVWVLLAVFPHGHIIN